MDLKFVFFLTTVFALILTIFIFLGTGDPIQQIEEITYNVTFSGSIKIAQEEDDMLIEYLLIESPNFIEDDDWQDVLSIHVSEPYKVVENKTLGNKYVQLNLSQPKIGVNEYQISSIVKVRQRSGDQYTFSEGSVLSQYFEPSPLVESDDPELIKFANELTKGAESKREEIELIARGTNKHVDYSQELWPVAESARWTYDNRLGACDEYTHLASALLRARGIPARFVFGVTPSTGFLEGWQRHSWVEAFDIGSGEWIPVDPTWGEFDYIDAAHIKMAVDIDQSFVEEKATLRGYGVSLESLAETELNVEVLEIKEFEDQGLIGIIRRLK